MERPITDYLYVFFDKAFEDETESGLIIDTEDYASEEDPDRKKVQHRRIWGTVIATPLFLDDTKLNLKDPGMPWPKRSITGESIAMQVKRNPRGKHGAHEYSCGGFEPEFELLSDYPQLAVQGDKIYVHHDAFDKPLAPGVYMIRYDSVICIVRNGEIITCTDHNLVTPRLLDGQDIYSQAGLLMMLGKDNVVPLRGYLQDETEIAFMPDADWVNRIEGKEYYVIKTKDIIMEFKNNIPKMRPGRVMVEMEAAALETDGGILVPDVVRLKEKPAKGMLLLAADDVHGMATGDTVVFAAGAGVIMSYEDRDVLILKDTDIFATL